jgi:hypothetical protein
LTIAPKRGTPREVEATTPVVPERRFVDVDPWAVLLEQLMEVPEEEPAERKDDKTGQGRGSVSPRSR